MYGCIVTVNLKLSMTLRNEKILTDAGSQGE